MALIKVVRRVASARPLVVKLVLALAVLAASTLGVVSPASAVAATVTPSTLGFPNTQVGDNSAPKSITVTISKDYVLASPDQYGHADISGSNEFQVTSVPANCFKSDGESCVLGVTFEPTQVGAASATLTIQVCLALDSFTCSTYPVSLTGTATFPGSISPTHVAFTPTPKGKTVLTKITVTVATGWQVIDITASGDPAFEATNIEPDCGPIGPGSCVFDASFTPYQNAAVSGSINVRECNVHKLCVTGTVTLSGSGTAAATISPKPVAFTNVVVGLKKSMAVTVNVLGGWYVQGFVAPAFPFNYEHLDNGCGATGPVTCTFYATFAPPDYRTYSSTLGVVVCSLSGQYCETETTNLTGTGTAPGTISPSPVPMGSPKVGSYTLTAVTVTYIANWRISSVTFSVPGTVFTSDEATTCNPAPAGKCTFNVKFAPQALGPQAATMTVRMCQIEGSLCTDLKPDTVNGTGTAPATQTPTSLSFTAAVLKSQKKSYTVTPDAGWYVHAVASASPNPPYRAQLESNCDRGPGQPCTVDVIFAPTVAKTVKGTAAVQICNINTGLCFTMTPVLLSGTGTLTATTTKLSAATVRPTLGGHDLLTATVSPTVDGGNVFFYAGTTVVCEVPIVNTPSVTCDWQPSNTGSVMLKAIYSGDSAFKGSTSNLVGTNVVLPPP